MLSSHIVTAGVAGIFRHSAREPSQRGLAHARPGGFAADGAGIELPASRYHGVTAYAGRRAQAALSRECARRSSGTAWQS